MLLKGLLLFLGVLPVLVHSSHDDLSYYQFSATLREDYYTLYWNFSTDTNRTWFAVEVQTTGWVGFGLSPNGQMPESDVVIGWVDDNDKAYFHDRFAFNRSMAPPIDPEQNWFLTSAEQENGVITLQFYRDFITCDDRDRNILFETSHVIYSWNDNDPVVTVGDDGTETYTFQRHQDQGTTPINILGGLPNRPSIPDDAKSFSVAVNGITIPSNPTTYWCAAVELDSTVQQNEQYIIKYSPILTSGNEQLVHHMLVYACDDLQDDDLGPGSDCDYISDRVSACLGAGLIAGWAVGGSDFFYPENVALPVGGPNNPKFAVIQMHYNNEHQVSGRTDSSGIEFTYISTPREHDAGILEIGHHVTTGMIIPPKAKHYLIPGICASECTEVFPEEGINIFANILHTHLAGVGLKFSKLQEVPCNSNGSTRLQETVIDQNLNYDFNFQQAVHLPTPINVKRGESFYLECYYNTLDRDEVVLGGESTLEEMCLSFAYYYPRTTLNFCLNDPHFDKFNDFISSQVPREHQAQFEALTRSSSRAEIEETFNLLDWSQDQIDALEEYVYTKGTLTSACRTTELHSTDVSQPSICCSHEVPDVCTGSVPEPCCTRTCPQSTDGAPGMGSSLVLLLCLLLVILYITT